MAITISLSTLLLAVLGLAIAYGLYRLYDLFIAQPKQFLTYWESQGITGEPFAFPLGQLPAIQKAAESDTIIQYAQSMYQKHGGLQTQQVGPICNLVVYDPEACRSIFTNKAHCYHKATSTQKDIIRPLLHNGLLLSEGDYWKQQRTLLSPGFHYFYLEEMVPIIVECIEGWCSKVDGLIDASSAASIELEMSHELASMTLDSVATAAFGSGFRADPARADSFIHSLKEVLEAMQGRSLNLLGFLPVIKDLPLPSLKVIQRGCANIDRIVGEIVQDRKTGKSSVKEGGTHAGTKLLQERAAGDGGEVRRHDLLDLLLDAQKNMPPGQTLTDRGVEEESINFIAAGAETTSNLCIWMLWRLLSEPAPPTPPATGVPEGEGEGGAQQRPLSLMEKVLAEIDEVCGPSAPSISHLKDLKFMEAVAYESLRLHAPAPTMPKYCVEAHELSIAPGRTVHVPKDTLVLINANVIHRLPAYWPEPEVFKPERFLQQQVPTQAAAAQTEGGMSSGVNPLPSPTPATSEESGVPAEASPLSNAAQGVKGAPLTAAEKSRKAAQPFAFLGFSAGPRKCIGKNLAMIEIKVIFTLLLQRFEFSILPDQYIAPNPITRMPKNGIKMTIRRRVAPPAAAGVAGQGGEGTQGAAQDGTGVRHRSTAAGVSVLKPTGMI